MLEGLKGNSLQRSMSENSEADQLDENEKLAKNHVEQILDEIIERVLTQEEMRQMNSIWNRLLIWWDNKRNTENYVVENLYFHNVH